MARKKSAILSEPTPKKAGRPRTKATELRAQLKIERSVLSDLRKAKVAAAKDLRELEKKQKAERRDYEESVRIKTRDFNTQERKVNKLKERLDGVVGSNV